LIPQQQDFDPVLEQFYTDTEKGIDFILSHLEEPLVFPRRISTQKSQNKQFSVRDKQDIINSFVNSKLIDCRINAFPILKEGATWIPDFLFIDLDLADFNCNKRSLNLALNKTLKTIREKLIDDDYNYDGKNVTAHPTVLWSGNGYHILLPVYCPIVLEDIQQFQRFIFTCDKPSEAFLRFAKDYLSNYKADKANNPSFQSCLLRIPNSFNSKRLSREDATLENSKIKIIQQWNGYRPPVKELLYDFRRYLIQKKIETYNYRQKILLKTRIRIRINKNRYGTLNYYYEWIERILQTPFEDGRKVILDLILAPYLINIKRLSYQESYQIIREWLDKCNSLNKLDNFRNFEFRICYALKTAKKKGIGPMRQEKIKIDNDYRRLYLLIKQKEDLTIRENNL
jgi:hypothetical protein